MSLEWARARALQNAARRRQLAESGNHRDWIGLTVESPVTETVCIERTRAHPQVPAPNGHAANHDNLLGIANNRE
jgi:hypothetical protein